MATACAKLKNRIGPHVDLDNRTNLCQKIDCLQWAFAPQTAGTLIAHLQNYFKVGTIILQNLTHTSLSDFVKKNP
jgi:hypothetical protein